MKRSRLLGLLAALCVTALAPFGVAKECHVSGVATHSGNVRAVLTTPGALWVASDGGVEEFDRQTRELLRKYTHLDGLTSLGVVDLSRSARGSIQATLDGATCELRGSRFSCSPRPTRARTEKLRFSYHHGARETARRDLPEGPLIGTAGRGAYLGDERLGRPELPDRHVTSLALFQGRLWVGTFNGGLAREDRGGALRPVPSPGNLVNALQAGPQHLYIGTSHGLFRTRDGNAFEKVEIVEQAVVGLAFDGTSIWASTPGALYRIRDGRGPRSDVWWVPGGSRSLQKVSAVPGHVWMGSEDRGAIAMRVGPDTMSKDKPFIVYDRSHGLASSWSLAVAARPDGSAWMTTLREGLSFVPSRGEPVSVPTGVSDWGLSALTVPGGVFIGTQGGATFVSDDGAQTYPILGLPDQRVHTFLLDERSEGSPRLWIGTENGLAWCEL